jgi:hypothetical protein
MSSTPSPVDILIDAAISASGPIELEWADTFLVTACPEPECVMVSVIAIQQTPLHLMDLLERRATSPQKFGAWLPALRKDDRVMLLRKIPHHPSVSIESFPELWLSQAQELLS